MPPVEPMLARLERVLPAGDYFYEPKWDGFRALAFVDPAAARGAAVDLRSRHGRALGRYFPELVEALRAPGRSFVLDGEIVVARPDRFDFAALLTRIHPAGSRVERLRREAPATFIAFDLLARDGEDLRPAPFAARRAALVALLAGAASGALTVTPATADLERARGWLERYHGRGIEGVIAKARDLPYQPGKRAMIKVKREHTVDVVVAGLRLRRARDGRLTLGSLLLGLHDGVVLRHVGVSATFTAQQRRELLGALAPLVVPPEGHPWEHGFNVGRSPMGRLPGSAGRWDAGEMVRDWVPLAPVRVCEVAYDQRDGARFRHPARLVRWRPDRDPASCGFDQLASDQASPAEVLAP